MLRGYIFKKAYLTVFIYTIMILVMISGGVDQRVIELSRILVFLLLCSLLYLFPIKKKYHLFIIYYFFFILFIFFFLPNKTIDFSSRFFGKDIYDSELTATLKLLVKIIVLFIFFPINLDIKAKLARVMSFLILIFFLQATLTTLLVNIIKIPIDELEFLFPFIGGVSKEEPYPLLIFGTRYDYFEYYRPKFYFSEPSGFGYAIIIFFFTKLLLVEKKEGASISKISLLAFASIIITISKAAIIIFLFYFFTKLIIRFSFKKKIIFFLFFLLLVCIFIFMVYQVIGNYAISRASVLTINFFNELILIPRGVNASLHAISEDDLTRDFTFYSVFYDLGLIGGLVFILIILRIFFNLSLLNFDNFSQLFPVFIGYLFFLFSGSNYASGGGLILLLLLYTRSKMDFNQAKPNIITYK